MYYKKRRYIRTLLILYIISGVSFCLSAHRVNIFAEPIGTNITVDCYYSNGDKVHSGDIIVNEESTGKKLYEGKTDNAGTLTFEIPSIVIKNKSGIKITLNAGMGHQSTWDIPYSELKESYTESKLISENKEKLIRNNEKKAVQGNRIKALQVITGLFVIIIIFGCIYFIKIKTGKKV